MSLRPPAGFISAFYDPLRNPNAPTIGTATGGDASASVAFTAPTNVGGSAISAYGARSTPGNLTGSAASSPVTVSGLTNGSSYTFAVWAINTYGPSAFSGASGSVTPTAIRGLFAGGTNAANSKVNVIDYVSFSSLGSAVDFGDLITQISYVGGCSSSTIGVFGGGADGSIVNVIQYVTFASTGNSSDFGDLITPALAPASCSSSTRGLFAGGLDGNGAEINVIQYITIASVGNATDFGDLTGLNSGKISQGVGCSSPTRGLFAGGLLGDPYYTGVQRINYVTIASTGNATNFGNLPVETYLQGACSSATRGVFAGGNPVPYNIISYVTIATTGNTTDFGDLTAQRQGLAGCSSATIGVFGGGFYAGAVRANMGYITIATTGDAADFGDLTVARTTPASCSNAHGGL